MGVLYKQGLWYSVHAHTPGRCEALWRTRLQPRGAHGQREAQGLRAAFAVRTGRKLRQRLLHAQRHLRVVVLPTCDLGQRSRFRGRAASHCCPAAVSANTEREGALPNNTYATEVGHQRVARACPLVQPPGAGIFADPHTLTKTLLPASSEVFTTKLRSAQAEDSFTEHALRCAEGTVWHTRALV